jgi:hypothetical protein
LERNLGIGEKCVVRTFGIYRMLALRGTMLDAMGVRPELLN